RRSQPRGPNQRIVRHKNQKDSCADANTDAQTSETHPKESFADSISESDTEDEIKAQKSISYTHTNRISGCDRDTVAQCGRNACSREEGLAQRESCPSPNSGVRPLPTQSAQDHRRRARHHAPDAQ